MRSPVRYLRDRLMMGVFVALIGPVPRLLARLQRR